MDDEAEDIRQDIAILRTLIDAVSGRSEGDPTLRACESLLREREERLAQFERGRDPR